MDSIQKDYYCGHVVKCSRIKEEEIFLETVLYSSLHLLLFHSLMALTVLLVLAILLALSG